MNNRYLFFILVFLSFLVMGFSNSNSKTINVKIDINTKDTLTWKQLSNIRYVSKKHKEYGEISFPIVNENVKKLSKKRVVIKGFIVPIDNKNFAISKNVFASCFFCGKAGPETIAGLKFKGTTPKLKTDQYVVVEGFFRYNEDNADDWIYNLDDAQIVKTN